MPDPAVIFDSRARTATPAPVQTAFSYEGIRIIIDVVAAPASQSLTLTMDGQSPVGSYYPQIVAAPITDVGQTILKLFPGADPIPGAVFNDFLAPSQRFSMAHSGAGSWTYTVSIEPLTRV